MSGSEALSRRLHGALAAGLPALLAASPWIGMVRQWPARPGWADGLHLGLGLLLTALAVALAASGWQRARWRWWLPVDAAGRQRLRLDLAGLMKGRVPAAESGGLFALFEGTLLLALLATGLSGLAWLTVQGSDFAMSIGEWHGRLAIAAGVALALHALAVALHLRDFF